MEFPLDELIEIFSSELHPNNDLKTVKDLIFRHPLMKSEYQSMSLEQLAILIYSVYFVSNGRKVEVLNRLRENIVFYIVCDFDYSYPKTVSCDTCDGDGETDCNECDGSGEVSCSECDGSGVVDGDDEDSLEDCEVCNGNGEVSCRECNGGGKETCDECDGNGEIERGEEINYRNLLYVSILPLSIIEQMKQQDGDLTTEFNEEFEQVSRLTLILDRDPYSRDIDDDSYYWRDVEEGTEMFYEIVDGELKVTEVDYPKFD
jgi:hypothetical protein